MMTTTDSERVAIRTNATQRLAELRAVRDTLLPDRDDADVLSELTSVEGQIHQAEQALMDAGPIT